MLKLNTVVISVTSWEELLLIQQNKQEDPRWISK